MSKKYRYTVSQSADGTTTGTVDLTEAEAEAVAYATNSSNWNNVNREPYSGHFYIDLDFPEEIED